MHRQLPHQNLQFEWSDGWLLMAVLLCSSTGAELASIIGVGDVINHAIFSLIELRNGFGRLLNVGLVTEDNGLFRATPEAHELYQKLHRRSLGLFTQVDAMAKMLNSVPIFTQEQHIAFSLSEERYDAAVAQYLKSFGK